MGELCWKHENRKANEETIKKTCIGRVVNGVRVHSFEHLQKFDCRLEIQVIICPAIFLKTLEFRSDCGWTCNSLDGSIDTTFALLTAVLLFCFVSSVSLFRDGHARSRSFPSFYSLSTLAYSIISFYSVFIKPNFEISRSFRKRNRKAE